MIEITFINEALCLVKLFFLFIPERRYYYLAQPQSTPTETIG
jgi:hypothetical protein